MDFSKPIELVLSKLTAKRSGSGWLARCPAHEDSTASLSISEGEDQRVLLKCFAGCKTESVCYELGITTADLFTGHCRRNGTKSPENDGFRRQKKTSRPPKRFSTAEAATADYEWQHGPAAARWEYHNAEGELVGMVLRWNLADGKKDIRPIALVDGEWIQGGLPAPRPLYNLPHVNKSPTVYIVEGEKCADALGQVGLVATTSPHGSQSPSKADWGHLAGKELVILPDNDAPGQKYANDVINLLAQLSPRPSIRVVNLPDLAAKEDVVDWFNRFEAAEPDDLRHLLEAEVAKASPFNFRDVPPIQRPVAFRPFPVDQLPNPLNTIVERMAQAIGCDPSFIALPLLTLCASTIASTRRLTIKSGWHVPPIIWATIVGNSGSSKTPALKEVTKPLHKRQRRAFELHDELQKHFEKEIAHYKVAQAAWERKPEGNDPPPRPEAPLAVRCLFDNTTVEALLPIVQANPRQPLLVKDELSGWFASFDSYRSGKGGDEAFWLSAFNGQPHINDRKTGLKPTIYIPSVNLCLCGGIQPDILRRHLTSERRESGLAARLLMVCPPHKPKTWTDAEIDSTIESVFENLVERLFSLNFEQDAEGRNEPKYIGMT